MSSAGTPAVTPKQTSDMNALASTGSTSNAMIQFVEGGPDILDWDFLIQGLPAVDVRTGLFVIADLSRGKLASSLGLSLVWLRSGNNAPDHTLAVLDESVASTILYERDSDAKQTAALAVDARARTEQANAMLRDLRLRPMIHCSVQQTRQWCFQPQRLICASLSAELQNDRLSWHIGSETRAQDLGWHVPPMSIGDGPPKEMIQCFEEAHFDPITKVIVVQVSTYCRERGSDACIISDGWRSIALR